MSSVTPGHPAPAAGLVLYDGVCGLCDRTVQFLLRIDRNARLMFAPLQGKTAEPILKRHGLNEGPLRSVILVEQGEKLYLRSDGILKIFGIVGGPWAALSLFRIVPRVLRDGVYDWIARNRYAWFGRFDQCRIPRPETAHRFLP